MSKAVTSHERPGVYSVYEATAVVTGTSRQGWAAVAARSQGGTAGTLYTLNSGREAAEAFGPKDGLTELVQLLMANGAARVLAVPVTQDEDYAEAFALLGGQEGVRVVLCDSGTLTVQQALRDQVTADAAAQRERIAVVPGGAEETVSQLVERAKGLNSERVVLVAPGDARQAAAVAGAICGQTDPALPLGGAVLTGVSGPAERYTEQELDTLILGGVTTLEQAQGQCMVIRGVRPPGRPPGRLRTPPGGSWGRSWWWMM